jgi:hypothetical protein
MCSCYCAGNTGKGCSCPVSSAINGTFNGTTVGCSGTATTGADTSSCLPGYRGITCGECDSNAGYGRYGQNCVLCSSPIITFLFVVLLSAAFAIVLFFRMKQSKNTEESREKSRMVPVLLAYLHVTWCVGAFRLQWPVLVAEFFTAAGTATASQLSFIDCIVPSTFYSQFLFQCSIPLMAAGVPLVAILCKTSAHRVQASVRNIVLPDAGTYEDSLKNSSQSMLFFLIILVASHPGITKTALELFN